MSIRVVEEREEDAWERGREIWVRGAFPGRADIASCSGAAIAVAWFGNGVETSGDTWYAVVAARASLPFAVAMSPNGDLPMSQALRGTRVLRLPPESVYHSHRDRWSLRVPRR